MTKLSRAPRHRQVEEGVVIVLFSIFLVALLAFGDHLGYLNQSLTEIFDDTFPGYVRPESWPAEFETR